jgi:hypothetical protein
MGKNKKNQKPNQKNQQEVPANDISELDKELLKIKEDTEKKKVIISEAKKILDEYKKLRAELELEEQQLKAKLNQQKVDEIDDEEDLDDFENEKEPENVKEPENIKEEKFTQLLEQFNQNNEGFIEIYRIKENGMRTKIGKYPIKDVGTDIDFVAQKFGGGDYLIVLKDSKGRFQGQITESYDEMAYPKPNNITSVGNSNPVVINTSQGESLAQIVQMMEKSFQQQLETQKTMAQQLLEITKASVSSSPIKSLKDLVELKALLQEKENNPLKNIEILMGLFTKGMEFGSTISQSNDDDSFIGLIKDLIPMIISQKKANSVEEAKQYIQSALKLNQPQHNPNPPQVLEQKIEPTQPNQQIEYKGEDMKPSGIGNLILNLYRGELLKLASSNYNPEEVADMILLKLPQDYYGIALDIANNPDRLKIVFEYLPELKNYEKWVEAVLDVGKNRLIEYFKSLDEEIEGTKETKETKEVNKNKKERK